MADLLSSPLETLLQGICREGGRLDPSIWSLAEDCATDLAEHIATCLSDTDWGVYTGPDMTRTLAAKLVLLDQIAPSRAGDVAMRLNGGPLAPENRDVIESTMLHHLVRAAARVPGGPSIHIAPQLQDRQMIIAQVVRWCRTKGAPLADLPHITVAPHRRWGVALSQAGLRSRGAAMAWTERAVIMAQGWPARVQREYAFYDTLVRFSRERDPGAPQNGHAIHAAALALLAAAHPAMAMFCSNAAQVDSAPNVA